MAVEFLTLPESRQTILRHQAFRAVLLAMAYPGRWYELPVDSARDGSGLPQRSAPAAASLVFDSMWDAGSRVWRSDVDLLSDLGAPVSEPAAAEILLIEGRSSRGAVGQANRGTEDEPETGATLLYVIADAVRGSAVRLSGPGIRGSVETDVPLLPLELQDRNRSCSQWPFGVELLVVDWLGRIMALPRSTQVELLD